MAKKRKKKRERSAHANAAPAVLKRADADAAPASAPGNAPAQPRDAGMPAASRSPSAASNVFIGLVLLYSIAMPASYYVGDRVTDERFAWRMFSTVRQYKCDVKATESHAGEARPRPVQLRETLHVAWAKMLQRGRRTVDERFLQSRCALGSGERAQLRRACTAPDGTPLPTEQYEIDCSTGVVEHRELPGVQ